MNETQQRRKTFNVGPKVCIKGQLRSKGVKSRKESHLKHLRCRPLGWGERGGGVGGAGGGVLGGGGGSTRGQR